MLRLHEHVSMTLQGQPEISGKSARSGGRHAGTQCRGHLRERQGCRGSSGVHALSGALRGGNIMDVTPGPRPGFGGMQPWTVRGDNNTTHPNVEPLGRNSRCAHF